MWESVGSLNLALAWLWITCGTLAGLGLGLFFHRPDWMGGYASHRRRLYRLGHISFFGLGFLNLAFFVTVRALPEPGAALRIASLALVVGAVTMPLCCVLTAHRVALRHLFAIPVLSVLLGCVLTLGGIGLP